MRRKLLTGMVTGFFFLINTTSNACTDFILKAQDGTFLVTRSLEFGMDLKSNLVSSPRGRQFNELTTDNKPAANWKAKYGYLYVDALNQPITSDGLNEKGLAFEYLYLPGETQYQSIPAGKESQAIPYFHFGDWILSNFATVDEVRTALADKYIYQAYLPTLGKLSFPLHAAVYDASGKGIIIEFIKGEIKIYDSVNIMTNDPTYDWQVANLRNFLNLSPVNPKPVTVDGIVYNITGQGAGMVGLPGDVSPPSRFVKTKFMLSVVTPVANASELLNQAQHIINNVDIPDGLARSVDNGKTTSDTTEWVVFKDLTHKVFYFRTYNDLTIRKVDMNKIDFSENAKTFKMPLVDAEPYVMDKTNQFMK